MPFIVPLKGFLVKLGAFWYNKNNMKSSQFLLAVGLVGFLLGAGCASPADDTAAKDAAEATDLSAGSSLALRQTVFGLGGVFAETMGGDNLAEYQVAINSFVPNDSVSFAWSSKAQQETAASAAARAAYEAADHPIGDTTTEPAVVYETITKTGVYTSPALASAINLLLPSYWSEGDQTIEDSSLIWLSKKQYDELASTKETTLSLGLFDAELSSLASMTDTVRNAINALQQKAADASQSEDIYKLTAEDDWGTFSLKIDGAEKTVRTIEASNWFGSYVILANPENPLVLKATLNPFALGSLDFSSLLSSFLGYEVTEVKLSEP